MNYRMPKLMKPLGIIDFNPFVFWERTVTPNQKFPSHLASIYSQQDYPKEASGRKWVLNLVLKDM